MIAAAYARYSTANQQETSIAAQLEGIRAYCEREGVQLCAMPYIDEARSGTNTDRPGFQRLLADARAGQFDAVVVYDISRGSRDVADWFMFRREMQALGVRVLSATNALGDMDDPNAFLQELLSVGLGQHMVLQSRQKSIAGKRIRAGRGLFCGGVPPLGYDVSGGHYTINPFEADAVRLIFDRYAAGASYADIIAELERLGVRTKQGNRIERAALHDILKNERYTGRYIWFDREERHMHKHVGRDNPNKIIIEGGIPPIVSKEVFEAVSDRMQSNCAHRRTSYRTYLLSGLIRCGECGSAMSGVTTRSKGREYPCYVCLGKRTEKRCSLKNVKADELDAYIVNIVKTQILTEAVMEGAARRLSATLATQSCLADDIRAELSNLERKNRALTNLAVEVGLTPETKRQLLDNEQHRQQLEARLASVAEPAPITEADVLALIRRDAETLERHPESLREIVRHYVLSVTVFDTYINIVYAIDAQKQKNHPSADANGCNIGQLPRCTPLVLYTQKIPRPLLAAS